MNYTKIFLFITLFVMTTMKSQTNTMVTTNIQSHLINKFWSSNIDDNNKVVFNFTQNGLSPRSRANPFACYLNKNIVFIYLSKL